MSFGTSGHRGSSLARTFNEDHIVAISAAIARYRAAQGIGGPLFLGRDTHALSEPAFRTAVEVLVGARRRRRRRRRGRLHADAGDLARDPARTTRARGAKADGIVITPSHNPPEDGGFKYNPPHGGPADTDVTRQIQDAAERAAPRAAARCPAAGLRTRRSSATRGHDYRSAYVGDLGAVVDVEEIAGAGIRLGVDPLGGASVAYWEAIAERYRIDLEVVNDRGRPDVLVHAARPRRQDPHGLLVARTQWPG